MDGIFISYRRKDRPLATSFLVEKLSERYGAHHVFHDMEDIGVGEHFLDRIQRALDACAVLIAVIGPDWLKNCKKRLQRADDPVRLEISSALAKNVIVIPVVLSHARMPRASDLPDDLQELHYKNASRLRSSDIHSDFSRLIERLDQVPLLAEAARTHRLGNALEEDPVTPTEHAADVARPPLDTVNLPGMAVATDASIPRFTLRDGESDTTLPFAGSIVELNRAALDPGNLSISAVSHARFEYDGGGWSVSDVSSNNASFIGIGSGTPLQDNDWLVFGSAVFQFRTVAALSPENEDTIPLTALAQWNHGLKSEFQLLKAGGTVLRFYGDLVTLDRDSLDRDNPSISRQGHARLNLCAGNWYITDLSSNSASYIQIKGKTPLADGTGLLFGRKVYTFHYS